MLSLITNAASMAATKAMNVSQREVSASAKRLGTGLQVQSAVDDTAGLQIATRLDAQTRGLAIAQRNTQNAISMLQTADAALGGISNILLRMNDLAIAAFDGSASLADKTSMQAEFDELGRHIGTIIRSTSFAGEKLFDPTVVSGSTSGKLSKGPLLFQIGASAAETMTVDVSNLLNQMTADATYPGVGWISATYRSTTPATDVGLELTTFDSNFLNSISGTIDKVSEIRSAIGAASNSLAHTNNNLSNIASNTELAKSRIIDADYANESVSYLSGKVKLKMGGNLLKQSSRLNKLVLGLFT
jgi:flagellin